LKAMKAIFLITERLESVAVEKAENRVVRSVLVPKRDTRDSRRMPFQSLSSALKNNAV